MHVCTMHAKRRRRIEPLAKNSLVELIGFPFFE